MPVTLVLPSGIGDVSWVLSGLWSVRDQIGEIQVLDGAPRRTVPYLEVCGFKASYTTTMNYSMILQAEHAQGYDWMSHPTWEYIKGLGLGCIPLEANQHLENGLPLHEWLPDLPTEYHYPLHVSEEDKLRCEKTMQREMALHPMKEGPVVGISCASYRGAEAWRSWGIDEWIDCLRRVMRLGWRPLLVGGAWDDLTYAVACDLELPSTVGKTSVAQMVHQMSLLDAYLGYSSGMNVIRTVLDKPAMAIWPDYEGFSQAELSRSWAPPAMLESHRYEAALWRPVRQVWPVAKAFLRRCEQELAPTPRLAALVRKA